jgi:ATP-dependent RNA helicase DHX29
MDRVDETIINYELIEDTLALVCSQPEVFSPPDKGSIADGATLIFLPGMGEIRRLSDMLRASRFFGNCVQFEIIPLHSSLSASEQRKAFKKSREGMRKIIISTNIGKSLAFTMTPGVYYQKYLTLFSRS